MTSHASLKVVLAALVGNALIAITKFVAAAFTGSSAMLSEGVHSVADTGNQLLLLYGMRAARKPPDDLFPFGHGKEIYFWSFVVAILIFAVGAGVSTYEGIVRLLDPHPVKHAYVNYIVLGLSMVFEGVAWTLAYREFGRAKGRLGYVEAVRRGKDPTLFVVLFEDSAAMLGLVVAFSGIWLGEVTGIVHFDGMASIVIGIILGATAVWLAVETKGLLIGERAAKPVVDGIREITSKQRDVEHVNEVLTMHMGPEFVLANLSVEFANHATSGDIENTVAEIDAEVRRVFPDVKRVFIEAEASQGWKRSR